MIFKLETLKKGWQAFKGFFFGENKEAALKQHLMQNGFNNTYGSFDTWLPKILRGETANNNSVSRNGAEFEAVVRELIELIALQEQQQPKQTSLSKLKSKAKNYGKTLWGRFFK